MMILLDTCTLLWMVGDQSNLSQQAKQTIAQNTDSIYVSSITALEIGLKHSRKRLQLPKPPLQWFDKVIELHGLTEIPVNSQIAFRSTVLPPIHKDPADRILIATATLHHLVLLSPDKHFQKYKGLEVVW